MRGPAIGLAAALSAAPAAHAAPPVLLPSPGRGATPTPPLATGVPVTELRWRGRITSSERVRVDVDRAGRPLEVRVLQRLVVGGVGDYTLTIPVPARDVRRAPGSAADPGLRTGALLWQGFSPGGEVLAADLELERDAAAPLLPLRLSVTRQGPSVRVRVANATGVTVTVPTGVGRPAELAGILRALGPGSSGDVFAHVEGRLGSRTVRVEAPLHVRGEVLLGAARARLDATLGGGSPLGATVSLRGAGTPRVRLTATPVLPARLLRLPQGVGGARALDLTVETLARASRVAQYRSFLANPDPRGSSSAVYELRTVVRRAAALPAPAGDGGGLGALGVALLVAGAAAALCGGAVLWARS